MRLTYLQQFRQSTHARCPSEQSKPHLMYHGQNHLNEKVTLEAKSGRMSRFKYQQERKLGDHACNWVDMGVRFGKKQFLIYVGQYAKKYGGKP